MPEPTIAERPTITEPIQRAIHLLEGVTEADVEERDSHLASNDRAEVARYLLAAADLLEAAASQVRAAYWRFRGVL